MSIAISSGSTNAKTLLRCIQDAANELGIPSPTTVVGNLDAQVQQLLALANREGSRFAAAGLAWGGWPQLRKEYTFTLVSGQANYAYPSDIQFFMPQTSWDRNFRWQLLGPLNAQEWQVLKSGISPTGPRRRFRVMAGQIYIDPTPSASDNGYTLVLEYISNAWCQSAAGAAQVEWRADSDIYLLEQEALIMGIKWRWKQAKGLDFSLEYADYQDIVSEAKARAGLSRSLPLNASADGIRLLNNQNVPDTGFGS